MLLSMLLRKKNASVHTAHLVIGIRHDKGGARYKYRVLVAAPSWVVTEVVSEQAVLGVCLRAVSSRVLFMGV